MDKYIEELKLRDTPKEAEKYELGGDYYYKCHWVGCNARVHSTDNFCYKCGQRLFFKGEKK